MIICKENSLQKYKIILDNKENSLYNAINKEISLFTLLKGDTNKMTAHQLLTMLSRLPHDSIIQVNTNGETIEPYNVYVEISPDLYQQRDHVVLECK